MCRKVKKPKNKTENVTILCGKLVFDTLPTCYMYKKVSSTGSHVMFLILFCSCSVQWLPFYWVRIFG